MQHFILKKAAKKKEKAKKLAAAQQPQQRQVSKKIPEKGASEPTIPSELQGLFGKLTLTGKDFENALLEAMTTAETTRPQKGYLGFLACLKKNLAKIKEELFEKGNEQAKIKFLMSLRKIKEQIQTSPRTTLVEATNISDAMFMLKTNEEADLIKSIITQVDGWVAELSTSQNLSQESLDLILGLFKEDPEKLFLLAKTYKPAQDAFSKLAPEKKIHFFVKHPLKIKTGDVFAKQELTSALSSATEENVRGVADLEPLVSLVSRLEIQEEAVRANLRKLCNPRNMDFSFFLGDAWKDDLTDQEKIKAFFGETPDDRTLASCFRKLNPKDREQYQPALEAAYPAKKSIFQQIQQESLQNIKKQETNGELTTPQTQSLWEKIKNFFLGLYELFSCCASRGRGSREPLMLQPRSIRVGSTTTASTVSEAGSPVASASSAVPPPQP